MEWNEPWVPGSSEGVGSGVDLRDRTGEAGGESGELGGIFVELGGGFSKQGGGCIQLGGDSVDLVGARGKT
jgi:hypothetical protein